ncbi:hypothetical protein ISX56_34465, partial [Serratia ureilytica]|nr:hypothetical protein [Serratia ureilytica]
LVCAIKDILGAPVGDTLTQARQPADKALPGFKKSEAAGVRRPVPDQLHPASIGITTASCVFSITA